MAQASTSARSTSSPSNELHPPSWMDKEYFAEVLRICEKTENVLVQDIKMSPTTVQGDHYASLMFRATLTYDTQHSKENSKSLIIKIIHEMDDHRNDIFETEISIHSETIQKFEAELRKIGDNTIFGAKVLYYSLEPMKVIIFEDLCSKGYEVVRDRQCNLEEVKAAFLKLAKWHAVSYKLAAEGDTSVTSYEDSFLDFKCIKEIPIIASYINFYINQLLEHDKFKPFTPKLHEIQLDLLNKSLNSSRISLPKESERIFVLCHGDFYRKNMMFKHNSNGSIEDVILVGFQESYYGTALLDVLNGITMLSDDDSNCYSEIFHFYSLSFIESLKKLKFQGEIPKLSDLFIEFSGFQQSMISEIKKIVLGKLIIVNLNSRET